MIVVFAVTLVLAALGCSPNGRRGPLPTAIAATWALYFLNAVVFHSTGSLFL